MNLKKIKHKKGISPMIGYVLLISIAIFMSVLVYSWLKSYVPRESLQCPDMTSMFIKNYTCVNNELNLTIKNNGNFNLAGYFIRAANKSSDQKVATIDLSSKLKTKFGGVNVANSVLFSSSEPGNSLAPNEEATEVYDISGMNTIYFIELIPMRSEKLEGQNRLASCNDAKIREELVC